AKAGHTLQPPGQLVVDPAVFREDREDVPGEPRLAVPRGGDNMRTDVETRFYGQLQRSFHKTPEDFIVLKLLQARLLHALQVADVLFEPLQALTKDVRVHHRRHRLPAAAAGLPLRSGYSTEENRSTRGAPLSRSEEHTSELQSRENLVCRLLLEKKKQHNN